MFSNGGDGEEEGGTGGYMWTNDETGSSHYGHGYGGGGGGGAAVADMFVAKVRGGGCDATARVFNGMTRST